MTGLSCAYDNVIQLGVGRRSDIACMVDSNKNNNLCNFESKDVLPKKPLKTQALRIGRYSERCVRKSRSKQFASSPFLFFTRDNYDALLANVVSKARKFVP